MTQGWHVENIKAELRKKFGTLREFSRTAGVKPSVVSDALANPNGSSRVELIIAKALGVTAHDLWPDRWTAEGLKLDRAHFRHQRNAESAAQ